MQRSSSLIAVVLSAACFGTLAVLTPSAYSAGAAPLPLLAWRFVFSAVLLSVVAVARERGSLAIGVGDLGRYALLALTGYGAASVCFFYALTFADASVVAVLLYAYPAFVTLAAWPLLGERVTWQRGLAVVTTFIGCALVVGLGSAEVQAAWQGIVLGLGAAVGYTIFNLLSHRWLPGRSRLSMMAYTFGLASLLPIVGTVWAFGPAGLSPAGWSPQVWWLLAAIVLIPTFAAIVLYLEGIKGLGPSQAAVISTLEPLFTIVLAWQFLSERLLPLQMAGAVLVLAGVVAAEVLARRTDIPAPA